MAGLLRIQAGHQRSPQHGELVLRDQPLRQRSDQLFSDTFGTDPAHIKGILMRQGVVIQQLHRHRRRKLLGRFEQTHQQDRPQEFIDHPLADLQLAEQGQGIDPVVSREGLRVSVEIEHGQQQPGDAQSISQRQSLEIAHRGKGLAQWAGPLGSVAEHRCGRLQSVRRPEGTGGERGEYITEPQLSRECIDVGIVLPEAAGSGLERFATGGAIGGSAGGIGHPIDQGHTHARFTQGLGGTPPGPAGADHHHM